MKIKNLVIVLLAAGLVAVSIKWAQASSKAQGASNEKQETRNEGSGEFVEFEVTQEWNSNPFTFFKGAGLLLAAGDRESSNAMTIGWGSLGNIWGKAGNATVTVYVAEGRYTFGFMEKSKYFTVMAFPEEYRNVLEYMGTHSGRDGDKAKHLGLHTLYTENGTPYYQEASLVLECEIIYRGAFDPSGMTGDAKGFYDNFSAGVHHQYIGNIIKALQKQ